MFPYDYFFALALLTAPTNTSMQEEFLQLGVHFRPTLQKLAIHLEILDPREARYILSRAEDYQSDLTLLRRRYQELVHAPRVSDSMRFPEREAVNEMLSFNRAFRQFLDIRQTVDRSHWWENQMTLQETEQLYQIWDTVRDSRCEYYYVTVRRQALKRLRDLLGERDYYSGQLPPYVPLWRFHVMK